MWKDILKRPSISNTKCPNLKSLLNAVRSLPHSNADPERTFSVLSDIKQKKEINYHRPVLMLVVYLNQR